MGCIYEMLLRKYWIINLYVLLCNLNILVITSKSCDSNNANRSLPSNWPCQWDDGVIPFAYNFYALSGLKRMITYVRRGHSYLEERSCIVFKEYNPVELARRDNFTYLFYSYSGVLESCCLPFFTKSIGRRLVLITPICTLPAEVAHATLHGLGLSHRSYQSFFPYQTKKLLFNIDCPDKNRKWKSFTSEL